MIGTKYVDGSVLYNLRNNKMQALVLIKDGNIKVLKDATSINHININVGIESEKVALSIISKISHEAICEILELLSTENPFYDYVKELKEMSKS